MLKIKKRTGKKWVMLTAYDAPVAGLLEEAGVDMLLVGDSLGMVVLGYESTAVVTMDEMIHHAKAVRRGAPKSFVVADMPLKGLEKGPAQALLSAKRFVKEAGSDAVKIEWGKDTLNIIHKIVKAGIPVMAHAGLTPQAAGPGGFKVKGRTAEAAFDVWRQSEAMQNAGAFSVLLECIPAEVGSEITKRLKVPTIGIGAGPDCDGQVLVYHDMVGLFDKFTPKFIKRYAKLGPGIKKAVAAYVSEVSGRRFPKKKHSYSMDPQEKSHFLELLKEKKS